MYCIYVPYVEYWTQVQAMVPGMSMLANTGWGRYFQAIAGTPDPPEPGADGERGSVTAGSFTHYHNRPFFALEGIKEGTEILVSYGQEKLTENLAFCTSSQLRHCANQ